MRTTTFIVAVFVIAVNSCSLDEQPPEAPTLTRTSEQQFPDVLNVTVTADGDGTYRFDVTVSSPYDTINRYADAWRVRGPDGTVYGIRELLHDHATEQPFVRSLGGVQIPEGVTSITVEARDLKNGWGGDAVTVTLPPRTG